MKRFLLFLLAAIFCAGWLVPSGAWAATSGLSGPAQVQVGRTFQVQMNISGGQDVDTVRFVGTYPTELVELQGMANGSVLPNRSPGSSSGGGAFNFGAFSLGSPVSGGARAGTLTFRALKVGEAVITLEAGTRILSAGSEQLTGRGSIRVKIVEAAAPSEIPTTPPAETRVELFSTSHPDENRWYPSRDVKVGWGITGRVPQAVYIGFDEAPEGPAEEKRVDKGEATFVAPSDGTWYAHLVVRFSATEVVRKDIRIQVDSTAPRAFAVAVDHTEVISDIPNSLRFVALDDASGIMNYDVWIDGELVTSTREQAHLLGRIEAGEHRVRVRATDFAGNSQEASESFRIIRLQKEVPQAPFDLFRALAQRWFWLLLIALVIFLLGYGMGRLWIIRMKKNKKKKVAMR